MLVYKSTMVSQHCSFFFVLAAVSLVNCNYNVSLKNNTSSNSGSRQAKFWGVGIVRFENSICKAADGSDGTCYTRRQCRDDIDGGISSGRCAANIGVCCVVQTTCGGSSSNNNTYFSNPNFPNPYYASSTCTLTINKCSSDICQIRIDFLYLTLAQPNFDGVCNADALNIIGGASIITPICGDNSGSHVYVDFNGEESIRIIINTGANAAFARNWRLKIAQIGCDSATRAPSGCLQYYTSLTGTVNSFNYGQTISSALDPLTGLLAGTRQIANTNYGVCVAMLPGYCSITWTQSSDLYAFSVSGNTITTPIGMVQGALCTEDFIIIPNGAISTAPLPTVDRFCGNGFPQVTTSSKPFVLTVVTNNAERIVDPIDVGNRGFSLMYTQNRCLTNIFPFL